MRIKILNKEMGKYENITQQASEIGILDLEGNFKSKNIEGALRELSEKMTDNVAIDDLKTNVATNTQSIKNLNAKTSKMQEDIEYLKENGGGGGGVTIPTITSKFEDCAIQENTNLNIPIFFSSVSLGEGTAYVSINGIESLYVKVKQGNNNINIPSKYFTKMRNTVAIYVKDRVGMVSNQLEWTVIVGGIKINTTFDTNADWSVGSRILFPYDITTEIEGDIKATLKVGNNTQEIDVSSGYNEIYLDEYIVGVGAFPVTIYATVGDYTSNVISFNLVVSSSTELYISSTNIDEAEYTYGERIEVNYRLSKKGDETFTVYLSIDNLIEKTVSATAGNYYWTIAGGRLNVGRHTLSIRATSESGDDKTLEISVNVVKGNYTPLEISKAGLICDLNAQGKSNQDSNLETWVDASGNNNNAKIINANFSTNGFIDGQLVLDNDAYVEIPLTPWKTNATNGSTINIIYTPTHSGNEYARVFDYTDTNDPYVGAFIDILEANIKSENSKGQIGLDYESGEIDVSFVIDRNNKMAKIFIDGILSKYWMLSDTGSGNNAILESFAHNNYMYLNSTKGEDCGTNSVRRVLVYNRALNEKEIMDNHIANITDMAKQEEKYNFEYNNNLPKLRIFGDISNVSADVSANVRIRYESPNAELYGESFDFETANNPIFLQGTSSLGYVRKNYRFFLKDSGGSDYYFNPFGEGSKAENVFTIKCNYMESSHANGIGIASMVNDCVYDSKTPAQQNDPDRRTAINGFPIQLFVNDESYGTYTLQIDRYAEESLGYKTKEFPELICVEGRSNTDIGAGAFYKYGTTDASKGLTEWEYYNESFMIVAPSSLKESNYDYNHIKTLVEWVYDAGRDRFVEELENYFNKEYLLRYFLTVQCLGLVDSLSKNMHLCSYDGKIFYPLFYDSDTATGLDNSGYLDVSASCEIGDLLDDDGSIIEENRFNCSNSVLWTKVMDWLSDDLKAEWTKMRSSGRFSVDNIMHYMSENIIEKIPGTLYNNDQIIKYCNYGSMYQHVCHGNRKLQLKKWIRERIAYVDSLMEYMSDIDYATIRMETLGDVSLDISTYYPLYYTIKWKSGVVERQRIARGEKKTFSTYSTVSTDQEVILYYPKAIKSIGNIDSLNPRTMALGTCTQLNELECHSDNLRSVDVASNIYLRKIDFSNCSKLGTVSASMNVGDCKYLKNINLYGTSISALNTNASGGSIREIYYPQTIQSIILSNQPRLEVLGLPYGLNGEEIPASLVTVNINNCPNISKLNTSANTNTSKTLISMKNVKNLNLNNSVNLDTMSFGEFERIENVTLASIPNLQKVNFDNLVPKGKQSTLAYVGLSNCPKITNITMNCTSNAYEVNFLDDAILDLGRLNSLKKISSNCVVKGLKTLIVPKQLEDLDFKLQYGEGTSNITNIWVSDQCNVDTSGATVTATHLNKDYEGIDFKGMNIRTLDMAGFGQVRNGINFNISPTAINPNLNTNRDGSEDKPWFRPYGSIDLSNYELDYKGIFKGLDLDRLNIIMPNGELEDTDLTSLFEGCTFEDATFVNQTLSKFPNASKFDYMFKNSDLTDASNIVFPNTRFTLKGGFMGSKLISDIDLPLNVVDVTDCFKDCINMRYATSNWNKRYTYSINHTDCYYNCINIETIDNRQGYLRDIPKDWGGHGFDNTNIGIYVLEIPEDNYMVTLGDFVLDGTVEWGDNTYSHNVTTHRYDKAGVYTVMGKIYPNNAGIKPHTSLAQVLLNVNRLPNDAKNFENMFEGCQILRIVNLSQTDTSKVQNTNGMFKNCTAMVTPPNFDFTSVTQANEMYAGCNNIINLTFKNLSNSNLTCENIVNGCNRLTTIGFEGRTHKNSARKIIDVLNNFILENKVSTSDLSKGINEAKEEVKNINGYQVIQDEEIMMNMMASADIFELVLGILSMQLETASCNENEREIIGGNKMIELYATLIIKGKKTIEDVPTKIRPQVEAMLKDLGVEY
jgi:hypothetical protein|nr:MAG TPA: CotH kinase protein [Caudoviricetes sp.]